jgi:hypothetical protein
LKRVSAELAEVTRDLIFSVRKEDPLRDGHFRLRAARHDVSLVVGRRAILVQNPVFETVAT